MANRGGRPKLPPENRRTHRVVAYLTASEMQQLKTYSETYGVTVSNLARRAITGIRIAPPVSAENLKSWRDIARISNNANQCARALNVIAKRLHELNGSGDSEVAELDADSLEEFDRSAQESLSILSNLHETMRDVRSLLMGQWEGNVGAAQASESSDS